MPIIRKVGIEGEFVEGVEEKQVGRGEGTERAAGDEEGGAEVEFLAAFGGLAGKHGGEGDDHGKQHHDDAHAIDEAEGQVERGLFEDRQRRRTSSEDLPGEGGDEAEREIDRGSGDGGEPGGRAEEDRDEREDR